MIRAVVSVCPTIFRRNQCTHTERHSDSYESVIQILHPIVLKIWNVQFLICLCLEIMSIYQGLY